MSLKSRFAGTAARLVGTRGAILCFHGLDIDGVPSRSSMHVSHERFAAIIDSARSLGTIVPLRSIIEKHIAGTPTDGLIAVTSDDTYASWLAAESLLARLAVPVTFFAVGNALPAGRVFWWDRIEELEQDATPEQWRAFEDAAGLPPAFQQQASLSRSRPLRQWLLSAHAGREPVAFATALAALEREMGRATQQRAMTGAELTGFLHRTGSDLAVHTASHAALPFLGDPEVIAEVGDGYRHLQALVPRTLPYLAIPFGLFDARTASLAARAGMTASLTLEGEPLVHRYDPAIGLARLCVVREQTPPNIALKLSRVAGTISRLRGHRSNSRFPTLPSPTT